MTRFGVAEELERQGYQVILCLGAQLDGTVKLGGVRALRGLSEPAWRDIRTGFLAALERFQHAPLDDLELR